MTIESSMVFYAIAIAVIYGLIFVPPFVRAYNKRAKERVKKE